MECYYCQTVHRKFYCQDCLSDKLHDHNSEFRSIAGERDAAVEQAAAFLKRASRIQALVAEKNRRAMSLEQLVHQRESVKKNTATLNETIRDLRMQIERKRLALEEAERRMQEKEVARNVERTTEMNRFKKELLHINHYTAVTRRILVNEVISLFDLKPGVVEAECADDSNESMTDTAASMPFSKATPRRHHSGEDLYICGVTLPARLIDLSRYPKEELNTAIGLVTHMLNLIVQYLGVKLPFTLVQKDCRPYIRLSQGAPRIYPSTSKMPLFWDEDKNVRRFVAGMAMLNYDIAYLCHVQHVDIPLSQVANTLQGMMACCRSPRLGSHSHAFLFHGIPHMDFALDFQQVLRITALRYRCGTCSPWTRTSSDPLARELNGRYLKVRRATDGTDEPSGSTASDDDEDIEDEDEDEDEDEEQSTGASDNWNLVDVIPSYAARTHGEGESLFQLGASFMPGVIGMMESLGGRHIISNHGAETSRRKRSS